MSGAFNCDIFVQKELERIIKKFNINHVIETGTSYGATTEWFAERVKNVSTIEIVEDTYKNCLDNYKHLRNINFYLGSSNIILDTVIKDMNTDEIILFYLDAHWYDNWPLLKELEIIGNLKKDNAIVIIDDFKVPNRNKDFDSYGEHECSLEYMQHQIPKIYSEEPFIYFNDKHKSSSAATNINGGFSDRGKLYMFPSNLKNELLQFVKKENNLYYSII